MVMAIVTPWSILLALTDTYSVLVKLLPQELRVLSIVFAGDFVSKMQQRVYLIS